MKKNLTIEEIRHVANLANLTLSEDEVRKFSGQLSEVLDYIEKLKEVETKNVEPTSQITGLINLFREDEEKPSLKIKEGFFKTKRAMSF